MPEPAWGKPQVLVSQLLERGCRLTGAVNLQGALVFRADSGVAPGIYVEEAGQAPRMMLPDGPGAFHVNPVVAGDLIAVHRGIPGRIPPVVEEIVFLRLGAEVMRVPGQALGVSADGSVAVVTDLRGKNVYRVDIEARDVTRVCRMMAGMHLYLAPVIGVNRDGTQAVFMDATDERCDGSLEWLDMRSGDKRRLLGPLPAPGRISASFSDDGRRLAVMELRMAEGPRFTLKILALDGGERALLTMPVSQPLSSPAFVGDHFVVMPLTLEPLEGTSYGATGLVAADVRSGKTTALTDMADLTGRCRVTEGSLWLEGNAGVVRVDFT